MSYRLIIGDPAYSSWSLRGWLLFRKFGLNADQELVDFSTGTVAEQVSAAQPARTVPTVVTPEGTPVWDSLAIAEELASRHPDAGLWPTDPAARATARSMAAEMHSGFGALRDACPMNLRLAYANFQPSEAILADVARLEVIWAFARERFGADGPWLCGTYSAADAFFAPVAARIATYGLPVGPVAQTYVTAQLEDEAFREWRRWGLTTGATLPWYAMDTLETKDWPGPAD